MTDGNLAIGTLFLPNFGIVDNVPKRNAEQIVAIEILIDDFRTTRGENVCRTRAQVTVNRKVPSHVGHTRTLNSLNLDGQAALCWGGN